MLRVVLHYGLFYVIFLLGFACHASISSRAYDKGHEDGVEFAKWVQGTSSKK